MILTVTHPFDKKTKSKTALHLANKLALGNERVLLIDLDHNAHLSRFFGVEGLKNSMTEVLDGNCHMDDILIPIGNLAFARANQTLKLIDLSLAWAEKREFYLKQALEQMEQEFDHIIIDCDSSLSFLTINAIYVSDAVILPSFSEVLTKQEMDEATLIHLMGCEQLIGGKTLGISNRANMFDQILELVEGGNKVLLLEQPIWTDEFLLPEFAAITLNGYKDAAREIISDFEVFLN